MSESRRFKTQETHMGEHCRRDLGIEHNHNRCGKPAKYIVWGTFFPEEVRGPRCDDCAREQLTHWPLRYVEQQAIYVIPPAPSSDDELGDRLDFWEAEHKKVAEGAPGEFTAEERQRAQGAVELCQRLRNSLAQRRPTSERCARDSDWCDGLICRDHGIDCPNADLDSHGKAPEEAVEAAAKAFERLPDGTQFRERLTQLPEYSGSVVPPSELARVMLEAALPAILAEYDKERERLELELELANEAATKAADERNAQRERADQAETQRDAAQRVFLALPSIDVEEDRDE